RRDDDVVGSRERSVLDVQALEAEVPQPERPRAFAGHPQRGVRTVHAHDGDSRELLGIERRQQADAAPEIKDGPGSAESFSDGRRDGLVVVVLLTVEDRQNVRSRGVVVKGYFSCDAGTRGSFLLDKPIQSGKVLRAERFTLPTEICVVGTGWGWRSCPVHKTTYFWQVRSASETGPRAWIRAVLMPIAPPRPNSCPSCSRVEAFTRTAPESTSRTNRIAAA